MKTTIFLFICLLASFNYAQKDAGGIWHSSFVVMGQPMLLDLEINATSNQASLIAPDQSMFKMVCSDVVLDDNLVHFTWKQGGLEYQGFYFPNGDSISGMMKQNGLEWSASFFREVQTIKTVSRPQTPLGPTNYTEQEISYVNTADKSIVYATLTLPTNPVNTNFPIVIFASGSGPQDRNCTILGHQLFYVLADHLAKQGIASLRFDDRGTGKSKASYADADLSDFSSDVLASIAYLKKNKATKKHPIGLLGHSEGGMHILQAQQTEGKKKVDFMVFLCSIGGSGKATLVQQQYDIPLKNGSSQEAAAWNREVYAGMSEIILRIPNSTICADTLQKFLSKMYYRAPKGAIEGMDESTFILTNTRFLNNAWGRQFLAFNAQPLLQNLSDIPILAIFAGNDIQVDPQSNLSLFQEGLKNNVNAHKQLEIIPGLNHLLQHCTSCTVMEYGDLTETINPVALNKITSFILGL